MKNYVWLLIVFLVILFIGCSSDNIPTISENDNAQAQLAPYYIPVDYNYKVTQINQSILAQAVKQVGKYSNNCKIWVQDVVLKATGKGIPQTDPCAMYQWIPSSNVKIVWQVKFACVGSFSTDLKSGQIMQIKWRYPYMSGGPHTIILQSVSATSIAYYEANAGPVVRFWTTSISKWQQIADAWTVYQVLP